MSTDKMSSLKSYTSLPQYDGIDTSVKAEPDADGWRPSVRSNRIMGFWIATSIFFAVLSVWLGVQLYWIRNQASLASGYKNELPPATRLMEIEEQWFEGSPQFSHDGTEYFPVLHEDSKYTGEPSDEIDYNWELLHWGRFFLLSEDEARQAWGPRYQDYWAPREGGYLAALDVMHQLHCIDHLRKAYYPEVYPVDSPIHGNIHRDHCLDHLRQMVMCNSDLTPIPSRYYAGLDDNYIDSDRPHTCRNFGKIRDWVSERYNGTLAVPRADGLGRQNDEWNGSPSRD